MFASMHLPILELVTALNIHRFRPGTACRRQWRSTNNSRAHRPRDPCRAGGNLAATIARRLLLGLALVACGAALAAAPAGKLRLRLIDGPTGKALAGSAVWIDVYVRQSGCSQDSCYGYRLDLTADGDGDVALPSSSPEAAGRPITELRVSVAGHEERHVGPKTLASTPPITLTLLRAPPDLADLRLRLVAAKTLAPLASVRCTSRSPMSRCCASRGRASLRIRASTSPQMGRAKSHSVRKTASCARPAMYR